VHVGIIMDGNGRWAQARGWPRIAGHKSGAETLRRIVECAPECGVETLTVYAFSSDNWKRPETEVSALMKLFRRYLTEETAKLRDRGVRFEMIGRRDRLSPALLELVQRTEAETRGCGVLHLRVAVDYSSRDAILAAAREGALTREAMSEAIGGSVDLLIRTGGERRLSDFLLWECAYAELHFTPVAWPDFCRADLERALSDFQSRDRRYGGIEAPGLVAVR
jgi:undecaprenyl diphosphate synthase